MAGTILSLKSLAKTYRSGKVEVPALRGVDLEVKSGDFLVITGRNGSGKSTLLHQLGLLDQPTSGSIILDGNNTENLSQLSRSALRLKFIGYIFQEQALLPDLTALENVMLPALMLESRKVAREKAANLLTKVGVGHRLNNLPSELSGGEQQKVSVARALINEPKIIMADEPTANLDLQSSQEVMKIFQTLNNEGQTVIMITHEQDETAYAKHLITLSDGKIIDEKYT